MRIHFSSNIISSSLASKIPDTKLWNISSQKSDGRILNIRRLIPIIIATSCGVIIASRKAIIFFITLSSAVHLAWVAIHKTVISSNIKQLLVKINASCCNFPHNWERLVKCCCLQCNSFLIYFNFKQPSPVVLPKFYLQVSYSWSSTYLQPQSTTLYARCAGGEINSVHIQQIVQKRRKVFSFLLRGSRTWHCTRIRYYMIRPNVQGERLYTVGRVPWWKIVTSKYFHMRLIAF